MKKSKGKLSEKVEQIYFDIRRQIVEGTMAPGERLVEERLAAQYGVSRTPIRETLAMLEADGLITILPNRGGAVRSFTRKEILDIYELRVMIEGYAARRAALYASHDHLEQLEKLIDEAYRLLASDVPDRKNEIIRQLVENNLNFHRLITQSSQNASLEELWERLTYLPFVYRSLQHYGDEGLRTSLHHHRMLIEAFKSRDPQMAEAVMKAHIYFGRRAILNFFDDAVKS